MATLQCMNTLARTQSDLNALENHHLTGFMIILLCKLEPFKPSVPLFPGDDIQFTVL